MEEYNLKSLDLATLCFITTKIDWVSVLALRCVCKYFVRIDSSLLQAANMISKNPIPFLPHLDKINFLRNPKLVIVQWNLWRKFMAMMNKSISGSSSSSISLSSPSLSSPSLANLYWWERMVDSFSLTSAYSRLDGYLSGNHLYLPIFTAITERKSSKAELLQIDVQKMEDSLITATCFCIFHDLIEKKSSTITVTKDNWHSWELLDNAIIEFLTTCLLNGPIKYEWESLSSSSVKVTAEGVEIIIQSQKERRASHGSLVSCSLVVYQDDINNNNDIRNRRPHQFSIQLQHKSTKQEKAVGVMLRGGGRTCQ